MIHENEIYNETLNWYFKILCYTMACLIPDWFLLLGVQATIVYYWRSISTNAFDPMANFDSEWWLIRLAEDFIYFPIITEKVSANI
jgi:hypothetical protein